ncbi:MAG: tetratricopeptide repeat protein [Planctomycetota bacterium]
MLIRKVALTLLASFVLLSLTACVEKARQAIPFLPQSKYVNRGGRLLTRAEVAYYQKLVDLRDAIRANPKDAVAYCTVGELFQKKGGYKDAKEYYCWALERDNTLSQAHYNLGVIYLQEDRFVEALDYLQKARALSPDDTRIRYRLGQVKAGQSKPAEALKEFDAAIALDSEYIPAYLEKSKTLYRLRRYAEATGVCRAALANLPKADPTALARETRGNKLLDKILSTGQEEEPPKTYRQEAAYDLTLCLKAQGQFREALTVLVQAEDAEIAKVDAQLLKAWLQDAAGDSATAILTLQTLRIAFPEIAEIPKRLARLYQKNAQVPLAIKMRLEAAELDHSDKELQIEAARAAEQSKDSARAIAIYERLVRIDSDDLRYRYALAKAYDQAGIVRQAALAYQEIVNRAPNDMATRRRLGMLMADLPGFQGRAMLQFKQVLEQNPKDGEIHRRLGELYLQSRNYAEAEKHIRQTLAYNSRDAQAHQNLATLMVGQSRFEEAVDGYRQALAIDPKLNIARLNQAKVLLGLNRREEAIGPLRDYLAQKPLDEEPRRLLAAALRDHGRREEAIAEFEAIAALRPGDVESSMELARLKFGLGNRQSAANQYEAILEKHPSNVNALREAGRLYSEMNLPLRAIYCWQRLLTLKRGDLEGQSRLANAYKQIGAEDAAIKNFEAVGKSGNADAWKEVAALRLKRNERDLAIAAYREAIKIKNLDLDARQQLAGLLQNSAKPEEKEEALKLYQEMLQIDSKNLPARLNLANLLSEANRLSEAQEEYEAILRDKPDHAPALLGLGVTLRKRGKYVKALETYQQALKQESAKHRLRVIHFNMGVIYDYYLNDPPKAQAHYKQYIEFGGDPQKLPDSN